MSWISRTRGKNTELAIAKELGARPILSIEVKHQKSIPRTIVKWMSQAEAAAAPEKIPCVVLHEHGKSYLDDLVVMRLGDLKDIVG